MGQKDIDAINKLFYDVVNNKDCSKFKVSTFLVDVFEDETKYYFEADIPGCNSQDIEVSYEGEYLTIEMTRKLEKRHDKLKLTRDERFFGESSRSFYLPNIHSDSITARYSGGVLYIEIQKK